MKPGEDRPKITIVVAMTRQRAIGRKGSIPWHIPEELRLFRELTTGHAVIMGRATFESIGRPLPDRYNIVLSRTMPLAAGVEVCRSLEEALAKAEGAKRHIFIIGGESVYRQALPLADAMVISVIRKDYAGDAFFPDFDPTDWSLEKEEEHEEFTRAWYRRRGREA